MKYMNFNNACPFTCIANMLEKFHYHFEDKDIIKISKLPYIFYMDKEKYLTGDMLQHKTWFNLFLYRYQLEYVEIKSIKEEFMTFLEKTNQEVMVGLSFEHMKHAVVFKAFSDNKYSFIYPHREGDSHPDYIYLQKHELESKLEDTVTYGYIQYNPAMKGPNLKLYDESIKYFRKYQKDFKLFTLQIKTIKEIKEAQETIFRPLLLTQFHMMNLTGNDDIANDIAVLQKQYLTVIKSLKTNILLYKIFDYRRLIKVFNDIEALMKSNLMK